MRVRQTIETMERQLHRRLTISELAEMAEVSAAHLTRLFREGTGTSPGAYLHRLRMARARLLLERSTLTVTEVMAQVGVRDRSHFARDFQRAHGLSPSMLRDQQRLTVARSDSP